MKVSGDLQLAFAAAIGELAASHAQKREAEQRNSLEYQALQREIADLNARVDRYMAQKDGDLVNATRTVYGDAAADALAARRQETKE